MIADFASRFDSFYSASYDLRSYMACKGYREEGDRTYWEPQYETDVEIQKAYGPGAMVRGELDYSEFFEDNDEPAFGFDSFDEF